MKVRLLQGAAIAALASVIAPAAWAQGNVQVAAANATGMALETVTVTAEKRETNLQKTPIAISVISAQNLEDSHAGSLLSLQDGSIPSLRVATFEARQSALTVGIRGIVPFDANQTARDQGVGVYIDGVYLGRQQGLNASLLDVERIEVLRGPQGTLFGRNAEGGALSIVAKAPTGVFEGRAVGGLGNYGSYNAELHQNFESFYNISLKVDGIIQHQDPTTLNPMSGQAGWNQYDRRGARVSALWQPSDKFSALLAADYSVDYNTPFFSQLINFNPYGKRVRTLAEVTAVAGAPASTINPLAGGLVQVHTERQYTSDIGTVQQPSLDLSKGAMATLKYAVLPNLELRSITAARGVDTHQWDNSGIEARNVFAPNANFGRYSLSDLKQTQFSQEVQAVGDFGESFTYVFGLYYFNEHARESAATPFTNVYNAFGNAFTIRSSNGSFGTGAITAANQGWEPGTRFLARASEANANSAAVFGQATYTPDALPDLHLTAGGRYTQDKRHGTLYTVNNRATNFPFTYDNSRFDPMVNVAYDLRENISLYAKYSTGYRAGGANDRSATFTAFGAEEVTAYEIGDKMNLLDGRLRVNIALWRMDRSDAQIDFDNVDTTPGSPTQGAHTEETRNAPGISTNQGVELDVSTLLTDELRAGLSYAYTDTEVPTAPFPFTGNTVVPQGSPFPVNVVYTPKNAASGYIDYERDLFGATFKFHIDGAYASRQYAFQAEFADVSPTASVTRPVAAKTDSSFIINSSVALANIKAGSGYATGTLSLWSRNLLDEEHIYRISAANRGTIGDYANFNPPRTYGLEFRIAY
ncbi:MAG: TonB-dependent receptor [Alphaproteobacteria bacterium]|nr:TonB-dependent receptor [Alphaproteobacteria bacterium]